MFPHTPHIELVMVFERIEYEAEEPVPSAVGHYQPPAADTTAAVATGAAAGVVAEVKLTSSGSTVEERTAATPAPVPAVAATAAEPGVPAEAARVEALPREETADHPLVSTPVATTPAAAGAESDTVT